MTHQTWAMAAWCRNLMGMVSRLGRKAGVIDPACDGVLKRFGEMAECPDDWPEDWKQQGAPQLRPASTIYRLCSTRYRRSICVKIFRGDLRKPEDAGKLYAALRHYHAGSDHQRGYTVPKPYGWVPEDRAVIMEWVEGRPYSQILKKELFSTKRRHQNLRKVAGWLHWFHSQSKVERTDLGKAPQMKVPLKGREEAGDTDKTAMAQELRGYLEVAARCSEALESVRIDFANLHDDFKPANVLISASGMVVGIDFRPGKKGPVSHDICRFLSDLDFYRKKRGWLALNPVLGPCDFEAFLAGYGPDAGGIDSRSFNSLYFLAALGVLIRQMRIGKGGSVHRMLRLAVVRESARRLLPDHSNTQANG